MQIKPKHIIMLAANAAIIALMTVANVVLLEPTFAQKITSWICPPVIDSEAVNQSRATGQELSKNIVLEGSVLVKNNGVLPLDPINDASVNVFGHAAIDWVYGGSGSGQVVPENNKSSENIDFLEALESYYIDYNEDLINMYKNFAPAVGDIGSIGTLYDSFYKLYEPSITNTNYYTGKLLNDAKAYSDTAFCVIGRHAGETEDPTRVQYKGKSMGTDTTRHYLEISTEEEELLKYLGQNYENVVVIVNSTNTMELDFLDTIPGIDACLVVGATGTRGAVAIPYLLYGEASPSGHFADTYPYDMAHNVNFMRTSSQGIGHYTNGQELYPTGAGSNAGSTTRQAPAFIDYIEGVYLGYKWFETADVQGVWDKYARQILNEDGTVKTLTGYDSVVQYPFGFGMSYTDFEWTVQSVSIPDGSSITQDSKITIEVRVKNIGDYPGKDVVQVYLEPQYYPGEIEKASANLVGFAKTSDINPGENEVVTIELDPYDFAAYDAYDKNNNGNKGYELDRGSYKIKLMTDSHNVKEVYTDGAGSIAKEGVIEYNVKDTINLKNDEVTGNEVKNRFTGDSTYDTVSLDGSDSGQSIGFISRGNFPNPLNIAPVQDRTLSPEAKKYNTWTNVDAEAWDKATTDYFGNTVSSDAVIWNQKAGTLSHNGVSYASSVENGYAKLYKSDAPTELGLALGADYNHPLWEPVLNQLTQAEAKSAILGGSFGTVAISSLGKPAYKDYDGPSQVRSFNAGDTRGTGFPCSTVIAQTWNKKLAYSFGINYGKEMELLGVDGCYGFGANLHRSPWGGRNYEYFSEDGFLSAVMLTEQVRALKNTGKYCYLKHLVLYETEHERDSLYTWCNEQALREIYLKPFKMAIQKGGCLGIMSSYNRIGNSWTGGNESLITGILRNEWGFKGTIVTDYVDGWSQNFMAIEDAVRAGGDILLGGRNTSLDTGYDDSPRIQRTSKEVVHHILYTTLNAKYTNINYNESEDVEQIVTGSVIQAWEWWKPVLFDLNVVAFGGCAIWIYFIVKGIVLLNKGVAQKKENE